MGGNYLKKVVRQITTPIEDLMAPFKEQFTNINALGGLRDVEVPESETPHEQVKVIGI